MEHASSAPVEQGFRPGLIPAVCQRVGQLTAQSEDCPSYPGVGAFLLRLLRSEPTGELGDHAQQVLPESWQNTTGLAAVCKKWLPKSWKN